MNVIRLLIRLICGVSFSHLFASAVGLLPSCVTAACLLATGYLRANGFVSSPDTQWTIGAPTQKAIILFDQGREDLILQAKYEGLAQDFGWLIPVPGLPEVKQGSMNCFHDLSQLTQVPLWREEFDESSMFSSGGLANQIKAVEIKTIGGFEVAVLSPENPDSALAWLRAQGFVFPKEKQSLLESYLKNHWYFVAVRVNPSKKGFAMASSTPRTAPPQSSSSQGLISGELPPLVISFPTKKCIYPLALAAVNAKSSEVAIFVLSREPLMSRVMFEKKFEDYRREKMEWIAQRPAREKAYYASTNDPAGMDHDLRMSRFQPPSLHEDSADPMPSPAILRRLMATSGTLEAFSESDDDFYGGAELVRSMEASSTNLTACAKEMPRLAGNSWWLTKQVGTFAPEEMRDLEFEPAVPIFAEKLRTTEGQNLARWLSQFGRHAIPVVLAGLSSPELAERRMAASAMAGMSDPRLVSPLTALLGDPDTHIRANACNAVSTNWDTAFAPRLVQLLSDDEAEVRSAACASLRVHLAESTNHIAAYRKMVEDGGVAVWSAMELLRHHRVELPKATLVPLLSSTDPCTITMALWDLRHRNLEHEEITPLLTNPLPMARVRGLAALQQIGDKAAVSRIVSMLRDPDEGLRWTVRQNLRRLSEKKLGADAEAWEKWWAENKETFTPVSRGR